MKAYKVILPCLAVGLLAGLGIFAFNANKNSNDSVDQTKLYIGIPKTQDDKPVKLHITVNSNSGVGYKEYTSEDLKPIAGQDKDIVFLDYANDPIVPLDKSIGYWLSEPGNSIKVQTECLELIMSDYINIDKAGIWFVNVASRDGEIPDFSHSYVYQKGGLL